MTGRTRWTWWSLTSSATWFWHIAFVDESRLVPCHEDTLRTEARQKIDRYIADHPPIETFPRFYLVLLRQPIAPMESDGMSRVYQM